VQLADLIALRDRMRQELKAVAGTRTRQIRVFTSKGVE
jgi:hypothetical protein